MNLVRLVRDVRDPSPRVSGELLSEGSARPGTWCVPEEQPVAILLNGSSFAVMMATPADLEDFAIGFALTEGIVATPSQIHSLRVADAADGLLCNLMVDPDRVAAVEERRRRIPGRSGCGICGAQSIGAVLPRPPRVAGSAPTMAALRRAFAALPGTQTMNAENRSTHAAAYCDTVGEVVTLREDIGRHNALDKLAGALARTGRRADHGFILLSSRISVEMVQKAAAMGTAFLAAVSAPSALALRQAALAGMGLACDAGAEVMVFDTASLEDRQVRARYA